MAHTKYEISKDAQEVWDNEVSELHKTNLRRYDLNSPSLFTCAACPAVKNCEFAFDAYNTDDDCLAEK